MLNYIKELIKKCFYIDFNFDNKIEQASEKVSSLPLIGKEYILNTEDPFMEDSVVIPIEIRGDYVQYQFIGGSKSSLKIETFNSIYNLNNY